jgi:pimeloyl-ACP methyl ester carboxylesterase
MPWIETDSVRLWYEQEGFGEDVLFIAGLADEGSCWAEQSAALSDTYRVTTFDNRAVGRSSTPDGAFQIADMAADAVDLLDALHIDRAHVVGSSMGGAIAQELVIRHPERVTSLTLHGTWAKTDRHFAAIVRSWQALARCSATAADFFLATSVWFVAPWVYNSGTIDEWAAAASDNQHVQTTDAFCRTAEALISHDCAGRLGAIACPTMVTVGSLDICTPERYARELVQLIPGARFHVFEGAGHMPYVEEPDRFTEVVREFLASCSPR